MRQQKFLDQARQLVQLGVIAAIPMQALADVETDTPPPPRVSTAALQADYAAAGTYSNSGWFTGQIDTTQATASTLGLGFKLSGERTFTDAELYNKAYNGCYDGVCDPYSAYYYRGDTTGIGFVWGGKVTGEFAPGDQLKAAYEFTIDWTHTPLPTGYDYASVNWSLRLGVSSNPYTPSTYQSGPGSYASYYGSESGYLYEAGTHDVRGEISASMPDYQGDGGWYWFAQLTVDLYESGPRWTNPGEGAPASVNGDYLRVVVPNRSIDVGVNAVPTAVPEAQSVAMALAGVGVLALLSRRRRVAFSR